MEGVSRSTSECHYQSCDRTFAIHQSLEERCAGQVPPLSGDERGVGSILFCHSDFEKSQVLEGLWMRRLYGCEGLLLEYPERGCVRTGEVCQDETQSFTMRVCT